MVATVWKGSLSFGLVSLPVRMFSAHQRHGTVMHQFQRGTSDRIRYQRVNSRTGEEVPRDEIVRGASVDGADEYVILEPSELESIAPGRSRAMEISRFVPRASVDPLWYDAAYYLAPDGTVGAKPYRLLQRALQRGDRLAVATVVMREREHLALIGPQQGVLAMSTLWWPDEIRQPEEVMPPVGDVDIGEQELELAEQLIDAMADDWAPQEYTDSYQQRLEELIRAKGAGRDTTRITEPAPRTTTVVELTQALRDSLKSKSGRRGGAARQRAGAPQPRQERPSGGRVTKRELQQQAATLGIPGRSTMTRRQLEDAVIQARSASAS